MEIEEQDLPLETRVFQAHEMRRNSEEGQDGVRDADVIHTVNRNMIFHYADNVSEKLQTL